MLPPVIVNGTRASLTRSRDLKRDAAVVQDSISAEDMGRFPDDNVADSLSHITGISVSRTHGGEGQYVNVRGLGPNFNIVTLNNRILATDGDGREFAFDVLPSETIFGADVMKSPQASQIEGSIGGAINLRSARPLDAYGFRSAFRVEGQYNDLSRTSGGKTSGVISNTFADNTVGLMLGVVLADSKTRSDSLLDYTYNPDKPGQFDANRDGVISPSERNLLGPCCIAFGSVDQPKRRASLSGAAEWRPAPGTSMVLDVLATRLDAPAFGHHQAYYVEHADNRWSDVTIRNGVVTGMTIHGLTPEVITNVEDRVVDTRMVGLNGEWKLSDSLKLEADAYRSTSKRNSGGKDSWVVAGIPGQHTGTYRANDNALPDIGVTLEDGRDLARAAGQLGNGDYALHWAELSGTDIKDRVDGLSLSAKWTLNKGALEALSFGVTDTRRNKIRRTIDNLDYACQYCDYKYTFAQLGANVVGPITPPNFMRNAGGSYPTTFARLDLPAYFQALRALDGVEILDANGKGTGTYYDSSLMNPVFNPTKSYDVSERTRGAFVEAALSGERWSANMGLRWVRTRTLSLSAVNRIVAINDPTPNDPTSSPMVTYSQAEPVSQSGSYTKVLPSLNFGYWFAPSLLGRVAAARTMARPSLNQLAPTAEDQVHDRVYAIRIAGDPKLHPTLANQADLSLEWYYDRRSMLTVAVFAKKITNFVTYKVDTNVDIGVPGYLFDITRPINGDKATAAGVEIGWQHLWANGFGMNTKITRTQTKAYQEGVYVGALEGVSKSAYSLSFLYEDSRINAQIALDHSGTYTEFNNYVGGYNRMGQPISWVTASLAYNLNKSVTLFIEGKNLTDAVYRANLGRPDTISGFEVWGRTYTAGLNLKL